MSDHLLDNENEINNVAKVKEEFKIPNSNNIKEEKTEELLPASTETRIDDVEYYTLTGSNPYFDLILNEAHVGPICQVYVPAKIAAEIPSLKAPVVLMSHGRHWSTTTPREHYGKRFGWRKFVVDNKLKAGDCCFFELIEATATRIVFKVIILRVPPSNDSNRSGKTNEEEEEEADGDTSETAIIIN
ncbi:OLC1v1030871C1 [Oldenlandia corymbosa var. corymbosa]|uniref:OLC1v1030871C1 n=1 Tax=Oldenlandia corymbosa var. corymbosa TaxID=529605 RepID=A0AAV1CK33_OLDCO|nr:OLC1v1030871C1 [Oldenlandia corymbosa var. corymbosa]